MLKRGHSTFDYMGVSFRLNAHLDYLKELRAKRTGLRVETAEQAQKEAERLAKLVKEYEDGELTIEEKSGERLEEYQREWEEYRAKTYLPMDRLVEETSDKILDDMILQEELLKIKAQRGELYEEEEPLVYEEVIREQKSREDKEKKPSSPPEILETKVEEEQTVVQERTESGERKRLNKTSKRKGDEEFYAKTLFSDFDPAFLVSEYGYYGVEKIGREIADRLRSGGVDVREMDDEFLSSLEEDVKRMVGGEALEGRFILGYSKDGVIYINKLGFDPKTVLHEYTHLWCCCVQKANPLLWERIKSGLMEGVDFAKLKNDPIYGEYIKSADSLCSELLAEKTSNEACRMFEERTRASLDCGFEKEDLDLAEFWNSVKNTLSGAKSNDASVENITNMVLSDVLSPRNADDLQEKYDYGSEIVDKGEIDLASGYGNLNDVLLKQLFALRPNMSENLRKAYGDYVENSPDFKECSKTMLRVVEEEAVCTRFFKYFMEDGKTAADDNVREYLADVLKNNRESGFRAAFESGFRLRDIGGVKDNGSDSRLINFANFINEEIFTKKNENAARILKEYLRRENSPELVRVMMLCCGFSTTEAYERRMKLKALLPEIEKLTKGVSRRDQENFGMVSENGIVTSNVYDTIYTDVTSALRKSSLSFEDKVLTYTDEYRAWSRDLESDIISGEPLKISWTDKLSFFSPLRRNLQKAMKERNEEDIAYYRKKVLEKVGTGYRDVNGSFRFVLDDVSALYSRTEDGVLTVPFSVAVNMHDILQRARHVGSVVGEDGTRENTYLSLVSCDGRESYVEMKTRGDKEQTLVQGGARLYDREIWEKRVKKEMERKGGNKTEPTVEDIRKYLEYREPLKMFEDEYERKVAELREETNVKFNREFMTELKGEAMRSEDLKKTGTYRISKETMEKLERSISLSDVASMYGSVVIKGRTKMCACPFHADKNPSMQLNDETGRYFCHGCGAKGSMFDFVMKAENCTFPEAVEKIAGFADVRIEKERVQDKKENAERKCGQTEFITQGDEDKALGYATYYFNKASDKYIPRDFGYLTAHGIDPFSLLNGAGGGARYFREQKALLIPHRSNETGEFCNYTKIAADGAKQNFRNCEVGHTLVRGRNGERSREIAFVVEGWADAVVLSRETGIDTYCSHGANNLKDVVSFIRRREKDRVIAIVADHDKPFQGSTMGIGERKARDAGADYVIVMPNEGEDVCDFVKRRGDVKSYVKEQLKLSLERDRAQRARREKEVLQSIRGLDVQSVRMGDRGKDMNETIRR